MSSARDGATNYYYTLIVRALGEQLSHKTATLTGRTLLHPTSFLVRPRA